MSRNKKMFAIDSRLVRLTEIEVVEESIAARSLLSFY